MSLENEQHLAAYDYSLDPSLIAASPAAERDQSRLLVYHRKREKIEHRRFSSLPEYLHPSDLLVLNDTRVFPARLRAKKKSGGRIELLLLRPSVSDRDVWEVMMTGKVTPPVDLLLEEGAIAHVVREIDGGHKEIRFELPKGTPDLNAYLERWGEVPLPPYIVKKRAGRSDTADRERYQTVYAKASGSAAAPTAGLHFTDALLEEIRRKEIQIATVTLHVGLGTFQPMREERIADHRMHREWFQIPLETAEAVKGARRSGGRVIAVGTTATRALESASRPDGTVQSGAGETELFITPGYHFKAVDGLITNFHLPKSTLLVLVSAFAGGEAVRAVYQEAIRERYRFYSYGDATLIL
ncbi:tRNA preQ1(34) S-adenosylmethionine ribosyltransferase-isomerase QueA [Candidatus Manganitrophus noduliformans]|uniref:S-adenosylmethionine:tRNA ribosyltransferase-isomerase n=1 Tax=Candidatus Manganitrophus noduliformans TaxID=2606439 RepID=A0A7X6I9H6_9BACT|nr:tRNA preQ1(34) S-adenosylmethionine ribosyltransferase-isomerase QueA [Candidatus Manganitrophus noduliformans]